MMITGIDIGGTKCSVVISNGVDILDKIYFETAGCTETLEMIFQAVKKLGKTEKIGVSCGGPLDSKRGIIMSPPNLPGWDNIPITDMLAEKFGVPAYLRNDADACALAEWKYGAGKGSRNMIFLTCGTGMGAGIIIGGKLYSGFCGMAGEIGHMKMRSHGPVGYGKEGSFEGFCSGSGIAQIGRTLALEKLQSGGCTEYCKDYSDMPNITAKSIAKAAVNQDETAVEVYRIFAEMLGEGIAVLIDILNPEVIVIGSIFPRCEKLIRPYMEEVIRREALPNSREVCRILPAQLGESVGDYAALAVAVEGEN